MVEFVKLQVRLDSNFDLRNFKLNSAVMMQVFAKTLNFSLMAEKNQYTFKKTMPSKNPKASKLNTLKTDIHDYEISVSRSHFVEGGVNLMVFCDDADFIGRTFFKNFGADSPQSQVVTQCPRCETDEQFSHFLVQNIDKIVLLKNPHLLSKPCMQLLSTACKEETLQTKDMALPVVPTFIFVIESLSLEDQKKQGGKKKDREDWYGALFKQMNQILPPEVIESVFLAVDLNFENNEVTFRGDYDNDKYMLNEIIQCMAEIKESDLAKKRTIVEIVQPSESFSVFSQISNIFSSISLGNLKVRKQDKRNDQDRLDETTSMFNLSTEFLEKYLRLHRNVNVDFKTHIRTFEKMIKITASFNSYFNEQAEILKQTTPTLSLFDFFIAVYFFEETCLLLHGPTAVNFGNKFPYLTFYLRMYFEGGRCDNDLQLLLNYSRELFVEIYQSFK
jgi:hypothetical protein